MKALHIVASFSLVMCGACHTPKVSTCFPLEKISETSSVKVDLRYKTPENISGKPLYPRNFQAYARPGTLAALKKAAVILEKQGYGLVVLDAWRPPVAAALLWNAAVEQELREMYAPPSISGHVKGAALDVTLFSLDSRDTVEMPGEYDCEFTRGNNTKHSDILRKAMRAAGFVSHPGEWWHFDYLAEANSETVENPWEKSGLKIVDWVAAEGGGR